MVTPQRKIAALNTTGRLESMTVQIAAASSALVLGAGRRKDGQWNNPGGRGKKREKNFSPFTESAERKALAQCGLVLDILGPGAHIGK